MAPPARMGRAEFASARAACQINMARGLSSTPFPLFPKRASQRHHRKSETGNFRKHKNHVCPGWLVHIFELIDKTFFWNGDLMI